MLTYCGTRRHRARARVDEHDRNSMISCANVARAARRLDVEHAEHVERRRPARRGVGREARARARPRHGRSRALPQHFAAPAAVGRAPRARGLADRGRLRAPPPAPRARALVVGGARAIESSAPGVVPRRTHRRAVRARPATRPQRGDAQRARQGREHQETTAMPHSLWAVAAAPNRTARGALAEGVPAHLAQAFDNERDSECGSRWRRLAAQKIRASPAMPGIVRALGLCALLADRGAAKVIKGQLTDRELDPLEPFGSACPSSRVGCRTRTKTTRQAFGVRGPRLSALARPRARADRARTRPPGRARSSSSRSAPTPLSDRFGARRAARAHDSSRALPRTHVRPARARVEAVGGRVQRA